MNKKTIFIVGGGIAALGIGYYLWTKRKKTSSSEETKKTITDESSRTMTTETEKKVEEFTPEQKAKIEELKAKISECEEKMKSARIVSGAQSPCAPLKQQYDILTNKQSADAFKSKIGNIGAVLSKTAQKINTIKPILSRGTKDE